MPKFISTFDEECSVHVESIIDSYPLQLRESKKYGMGLHAQKYLHRGELILEENPLLSTKSNKEDASPPQWQQDYILVASAITIAMKSKAWPIAPSSYLPFRCLGYTQLNFDLDKVVKTFLFSEITKALNLQDAPDFAWNPNECQIIYDKIKTNCFASRPGSTEVFCAASMINHSCVPNAYFRSYNSLYALRDIPAGEQIFISYGVLDPKVDLPELYGFECTCPRCISKGFS